MQGDWDMCMAPHKGAHVSTWLYEENGTVLEGELTMHTCTDICTPSHCGMGQDEGQQIYAHRVTQGCTRLCASVLRGCSRSGCKVDMHACTDTCTLSDQGVEPDQGFLRYSCKGAHVCEQLCKGDGQTWRSGGHTYMYTFWPRYEPRFGVAGSTHTGPHIIVQLCQGWGQTWGWGEHAYIYWYMYTLWPSCGTQIRGGWYMHTGPHRDAHGQMQKYKGGQGRYGSQVTCINVLLHVHLLIKMIGNCATPVVCSYVKGVGHTWEGKVDIHTCTDACTLSDQGV